MDINTVLHLYIQAGSLSGVAEAIALGADLNSLNDKNVTALYVATERNYVCIVSLLLQNGANPSLKSGACSPLETALCFRHHIVAGLLVDYGATGSREDYLIYPELKSYLGKREHLKKQCSRLLLLRPKGVMSTIAKHLWSTRAFPLFPEEERN